MEGMENSRIPGSHEVESSNLSRPTNPLWNQPLTMPEKSAHAFAVLKGL